MKSGGTMRRLLILSLLFLPSCCPNYSDGSRIGIVTKLSHKGLVFKSWEGEMLVALPVDVAGTTQPEKFTFNVDPGAINEVERAMQEGKRVELIYRQWALGPPTIDNNHVVYGIKAAGK